jgi:hypothetical protein
VKKLLNILVSKEFVLKNENIMCDISPFLWGYLHFQECTVWGDILNVIYNVKVKVK